jgi:hypothetical protein
MDEQDLGLIEFVELYVPLSQMQLESKFASPAKSKLMGGNY